MAKRTSVNIRDLHMEERNFYVDRPTAGRSTRQNCAYLVVFSYWSEYTIHVRFHTQVLDIRNLSFFFQYFLHFHTFQRVKIRTCNNSYPSQPSLMEVRLPGLTLLASGSYQYNKTVRYRINKQPS